MNEDVLKLLPKGKLLEIYTVSDKKKCHICYLIHFNQEYYIAQIFSLEGTHNGYIIGKVTDILLIRYDTLFLSRYDSPNLQKISLVEISRIDTFDKLIENYSQSDHFIGIKIKNGSCLYGRVKQSINESIVFNGYSKDSYNDGISILSKSQIELFEIMSSEVELLEKLKFED